MELDKKLKLMEEHGFSEREIKWIVKRANMVGVSVDELLQHMAKSFIGLAAGYILLAVLNLIVVVVINNKMTPDDFLSLAVTSLIVCVILMSRGALIKSFKSFRMLRR